MKLKFNYSGLMLCTMFIAFGSCTSDDFDSVEKCDGNGNGQGMELVMSDFEIGCSTRTIIDGESLKIGSVYESTWNTIDVVSVVTSDKANPNVKLVVNNSTGDAVKSTYLTFPTLANNCRLKVYYPYNADATYKLYPYDLREQTQVSKNNTNHLKDYDYMCSSSTLTYPSTANSDRKITMKHIINSLVKVTLTLPTAGTWTEVGVRNIQERPIFKLAKDKTSEVKDDYVPLKLKDVQTTQPNEKVTFYLFVPALTENYSRADIDFYAKRSDGRMYMSSVAYRDAYLSEGCAYVYNVNKMVDYEDRADDVDLGLSVRWAKCNLYAGSPTSVGGYFAWAESLESSNQKRDFTWSTYFDYAGTHQHVYFKTLNWDFFHIYDNLLDSNDPAMRAGWKMPTEAQWNELVHNCSCRMTTIDTEKGIVYGCEFYNRFTQKSIFLPVTGYRDGTEIKRIDVENPKELALGMYWTRTIDDKENYETAKAYVFGNGKYRDFVYPYCFLDGVERYKGLAIRPVRDK